MKTVCPKGRVGSNPTLSAGDTFSDRHVFTTCYLNKIKKIRNEESALFGEVPKMAEGTPLERVQVVNSGARVQIPPSPYRLNKRFGNQATQSTLTNKQ